MMRKESKIYIAGHNGMVGSAIMRRLRAEGYENLICKSRSELDLCDQKSTRDFFMAERPDYVFLAAAKVGGILANNTYRADFIYENLVIQTNVIHAAYEHKAKGLLFLGSSCIYPRECPQPIREEYLLTGPLEPTNEPYALAKIAGIKMCDSYNKQYGTKFISVMPTNMYGPNDNYDLETSHVLAALVRKFCDARKRGDSCVEIWGTGTPRREFLHVDDAADAIVFLMNLDYKKWQETGLSHINIGTGKDVTINELANMIIKEVGYDGDVSHDRSKPDGMERKLLDVGSLKQLGWRSQIDLVNGIKEVVSEYIKQH